MKQFKDAQGDTWTIAINGGTIKRALDLLKVDLGDPLSNDPASTAPPVLTRFDTEIAFKVDLIYVACLPEAQERGLTDDQFAERLEGDALYEASEGFLEALADFFQSLHRTHVVRAIDKQRAVVRRAIELADEALQSPELDQQIETELAALGGSSASWPRSPDASPSPERSAS